uniref:C2H2-type domain-containing protein n=1 Tax=Strix occidentalis caurina TaxID=311401 RepID=A0A8D0ES74_STROC
RDCPAPEESHGGADPPPRAPGRDPRGRKIVEDCLPWEGAHAGAGEECEEEGAEQAQTWSRWLLFMCLKSPQLSPFGLPTGAGTDKQKEEQCQPREEQRGMLQGPKEEPQSPTVDVEHDGQQQPDDTQGSHRPRRPRKSSFKGTYAEDCQEASTDPWSSSREKKYKCEHCEKVFVCRSKLIYHLRTHTGEKPYKCWDCGRGFSMRGNLLSHQRTHTKEKPFPCPTCGKYFSFRSNLFVHQRIHTRERPYTCSYCGKTFREGHHLRNHQDSIHNGESSEGLNPVSHHPQNGATQPWSISGEKYKCEDCGRVFNCRSNMRRHQGIHKGEKPYKCQDCGKSFRLKAHLLSHQRTHTKEKPFLCTTCGKRFSWRSNLITHQRIHTGERRYPGSHCGKSFQVKTCLRTHQESIHNGERPRKCSFKGTYAEDPQEDTTQPPSSSRQQKYECEYCGKIFIGRRNLRRHQQVHTGEKRFQCQDCGKRFRRKDHLQSHRRTHTKEKPYFCTTCGKHFSFRSGLINHQHTHTGVRPNTFSHCGETFQMRAHLREYQQIHQNSDFLAGA